ncbi:MAG: ComEC/Rec2 family competence protein [Rhizobiaceae bacterium]
MAGEPVDERVSERALFALADDVPSPPVPVRPSMPVPEIPAAEVVRIRQLRPPKISRRAIVRAWSTVLALERDRGVAFLLAPPLMIAGVFAYLALPVEPPLAALCGVAVVLGALGYLARDRQVFAATLTALLIFVLGAICARFETWRASTKMLGSEITTRLTARVVDIDHLANSRIRLTVDVLGTERPKLRYAPDRVRVSTTSVPDGLVAGSTIVGVARLFPPSGPLRPGSYDFSFESYFDGIGANGFFYRRPQLVATSEAQGLAAVIRPAIDNFRNRVAGHVREAIGGAEGEIAAALIVGVRAGIPEPVNEALRRTGLAHILSISGLHMALVAASIMGALRLGFAFFPDFASRHAVKKFAAGVALVAVAAYLLISGAEVAAQRSFIMLAVMLVAVMFDRAALTMRNLAIAGLVVLAISPHEVVGPSFQMSFAATAALIGGYAFWSERREGKIADLHQGIVRTLAGKAGKLVVGIALTALIAGLATTIYGAWHFQRVSPLSLVANLVVTPIVSIVMWAAVFASVTMPFGLDGPFLAVMGWGLGLMLSIADWLSARSPLDAIGIVPVASVIVLTLAILVATLATTWLRLASMPLAAVGLLLLLDRPLPDLLIAEDGRLVGVRTADGNLAVNRTRPNGFTAEDWRRALVAGTIVKPAGQGGFTCKEGVCSITHSSGVMIIHVENGTDLSAHCETAAIIVAANPAARNSCGKGQARVFTGKELARRGAATSSFRTLPEGVEIVTEFAVAEPYRPWHEHRQFSRAARGREPYRQTAARE